MRYRHTRGEGRVSIRQRLEGPGHKPGITWGPQKLKEAGRTLP